MPATEEQLKTLIETLGANADREIGDAQVPFPLATFQLDHEIGTDDLAFPLSGSLAIQTYNTADDEDPDNVIGRAAKADGDGTELRPQIAFSTDSAWLKYKGAATVRAKHAKSLAEVGFSLEAGRAVELSAYRIHQRNEKVAAALRVDLAQPRFATSMEDVRRLKPGEAVALHVSGNLATTLTVSWSTIFAKGIDVLSQLVGAGDLVAVSVKAGLTAKLKVAIQDTFVVVFSRRDAKTLGVAVRKSGGSSVTGQVAPKIEVGFEDPKQIQEVLSQTLEGVLGTTLEKVDKILEAASFDDLSDTEQELIQVVLRRFDLEGVLDRLQAARDKVAEIKARIDTIIEQVANTSVAFGFAYEYSRLSSTTAVLEGVFADGDLSTYHQGLLTGSFELFLDDARAGRRSAKIERYLHEHILQVERSWGLGLTLGQLAIKGTDTVKERWVRRNDADGRPMLAYKGARWYEGEWIKEKFRYEIDLDARMASFSALPVPTVSEFALSLGLTMIHRFASLKGEALRDAIDTAVLWRMVPLGDREELFKELSHRLKGATSIELVSEIRIEPPLFARMLSWCTRQSTAAFADCLGEAMPRTRLYGEVRHHPNLRRLYYGPLWRAYLEDPHMSPEGLAQHAGSVLKQRGFAGLARFEREHWRGASTRVPNASTAAGLAALNDGTRRQWESFLRGAETLRLALEKHQDHTEIDIAFDQMRALWTQTHHVRALGTYCLELAATAGEAVKNSWTITSTSAREKKESLVITAGTWSM